MAKALKPVHLNAKGVVHVLGKARDWDEVLLRIEDFATEQDRHAFSDPHGRRRLTLDAFLRAHSHDPHTWHLSEQNSRAEPRCYYVDLDRHPDPQYAYYCRRCEVPKALTDLRQIEADETCLYACRHAARRKAPGCRRIDPSLEASQLLPNATVSRGPTKGDIWNFHPR